MTLLRQRHRTGFTLIELVVAAAITVMIMLGLLAANFRSTATWLSETKRAELEQNLRYAADVITMDVRQAVAIATDPTQPNAMTTDLTIEYTDPQLLYHRIRALYHRVTTGNLAKIVRVRTDLTATPQVVFPPEDITESITSLSSLYFIVRGPRVTVVMVAQFPVGNSQKSVTYVAQASARNLGPAPE
jgi:type II secretory pathway pseudopilin PulG